MEEQVASRSVSARLAALNINHLARTPGQPGTSRHDNGRPKPNGPPALPARPNNGLRRNAASDSPVYANGSTTRNKIGNEPIDAAEYGSAPPLALVANDREHLPKGKPPLPPRLPPRGAVANTARPVVPTGPSAHQLKPKSSIESVSSNPSSRSSLSASTTETALTRSSTPSSVQAFSNESNILAQSRKLPPAYPRPVDEPVTTSTTLQKTRPLQTAATAGNAVISSSKAPPPLPARRVTSAETRSPTPASTTSKPKRSALSFGLNEPTEIISETLPERPSIPLRAVTDTDTNGLPPSIPLASKPSADSVQTFKRPSNSYAGQRCLKCWDFSTPDEHATRFPRHMVPSASTEWLAYQLTSPFPSLIDKARVIFTWLHHNIEYDVESFFNNAIKHSTPASTISRGLAVCEGYAGLFTAIATHAGLESVVVSGHGKGYGHSSLTPNSPIPPFNTGHAWNAVKIDGGAWKLMCYA